MTFWIRKTEGCWDNALRVLTKKHIKISTPSGLLSFPIKMQRILISEVRAEDVALDQSAEDVLEGEVALLDVHGDV